MTSRGSHLIAVALIGVTLAACATAPPEPQPTSRHSITPSAPTSTSSTATPSSTPSATTSPTNSPTTPPPVTSDPPPQRVVGLTASMGGGSGEVLVRWTQNPEADIDHYIVLRALTPGGTLTRIGTVTPEEVTQFEYVPFVDTQASVAYYRVRAVDAAGQQGPKSAEVCGASVGYSC